MNDLINASLVYDGGETVHIPPQMGTPRGDQMQGTPAEQLCELAGRVCYDSLGKGRPSFSGADVEGYHDHIAKVGHGSVWEHANITAQIQFDWNDPDILIPLFNRPGLTLICDARQFVRITFNLRVAADWDSVGHQHESRHAAINESWRYIVRSIAHEVAPHIVAEPTPLEWFGADFFGFQQVEPGDDMECWVSLFVSGSRGLSHELVRHGDFTAISQRSTRFVDESESSWVMHPLEAAWHSATTDPGHPRGMQLTSAYHQARAEYRGTVTALEPWLIARGVDKTSARKQARGAARGYLGNALYTELIFSASVAQWKRILRQRASVFADAEIREMACKALAALKSSRYGDRFDNWELQASPDGIGQIAFEREAV
jgi:thymidylate synthase ThyX